MSFLNLYLLTLLSWPSDSPPLAAKEPAKAFNLPWKLDTSYRYLWLRQSQKVGETRFKIQAVREGGDSAYTLTATRSYERDGATHRSEEKTTFLADATPLKFEETLDFTTVKNLHAHQVTTIEFVKQWAKVKYVQNGKEAEPLLQTVELPPGTFLFGSQAVEHWALFVAKLPQNLEKHKVNLFYPDFQKVLEVTFQKSGTEKLIVGKLEVETSRLTFRSEAKELQGSVWIDSKGRLIQVEFPSATAKELSLRVVLAED